MFRNTFLKAASFKPTSPLPVVRGAVVTPSRSASSLNAAYKKDQDSKEIWSDKYNTQVKLSEEKVRRFVVGLSTMLQDGMLRPPTSRDQVVSHFVGQGYDNLKVKNQVANQVDHILAKRTKVIKRKHDKTSVLEWIY